MAQRVETIPRTDLAKKTFQERVHVDRLRIIQANYEKLHKLHGDEPDNGVPDDEAPENHDALKTSLERMVLACVDQGDGTGLVPVTYLESRTRRDKKIPGGRLYAEKGVSLQSAKKWIRHTLCHDLYHDIDVVNAHPTLLLQLMEKWGHGGSFPMLKKVVHHRQDLFDEGKQHGFEPKDVKLFIIVLMYGGNPPENAWETLPWLRDLQSEFDIASKLVTNCETYQRLHKAIRDTAEDSYAKSKVPHRLVSHVLQEMERHILESCMSFLIAQKISIDEVVLCFDGFMVPRSEMKQVDKECLEALSAWVKNDTTWQVDFSVKPMDTIVDLTGFDATRGIYPIESDVHACEIIQQVAGEPIAYRAEGHLFSKLPTTGKWQIGKDNFVSSIQHYCRTLDLRMNEKKYSHSANGMRNITAVYEAIEDPEFPKRLDLASRGKVYWSDGVFDFRTMTFRQTEPGDMTSVSVPRKYPTKIPPDDKLDQIEKKLFLDTLGEDQGKALLQILARAVAGHTEDKRWYVVLGDRNSGKGVIEKAVRAALGPEYVGTYNIKSFQEKSHVDDAEYGLKWVYGLRWNRLAFSNESIQKGSKLDGNLIKQVVSGGDPVRLRVPHGMPFSIVPQCTFVNNANEVSSVSPKDALETCVMFHCRTKFVDTKTYHSKSDEDRPPYWREGDPSLKQALDTEDMGNIIWFILLRHYCKEVPELPESVQNEVTVMQQDESDNIDTIVQDVFEITGQESDFETSTTINDIWKKGGYAKDFSLCKLRSKLRQFHDPEKGYIVTDIQKRKEGQKCRGWVGIKIRPFLETEETAVDLQM